ELGVLAHHRDLHSPRRRDDALHQPAPLREIRGALAEQSETVHHTLVRTLFVEHERNLVDRRNVTTLDHRTELDIAEERDLSLDVFGKGALGSAYEDVGLYSELHELAHGMLGRFRFHLARRSYERNQGEMDEYSILASDLLAELAHRFEERLRFDVTDRSANLDYHNVVVWCKAFH